MLKLLLILISVSAFSQEDVLVRFKVFNKPSSPGYSYQHYGLNWYEGQKKGVRDHVALVAFLEGDKIDDVWLWQTYAFYKSESFTWVSPKLPKDCKLIGMGMWMLDENKRIQLSANFYGLSCKSLLTDLKTQKLLFKYTNVPVIDEERIESVVNVLVDDLPKEVRSFNL